MPTDPTGDVMYYGRHADLLDSPHQEPDIQRLAVVNGPRALTILLTFDNLRPGNGRATYGRIKTPEWKYDFRAHQTETGRWWFSVSGGGCPRAQQNVDFRSDVIEMRIPRPCRSNPRWVQVGVLSTGIRSGWTNFIDDPLRGDVNPTLVGTRSRRIPAG